jgi:hypothetical protein
MKKMSERQALALFGLSAALQEATECGMFDEMANDVHPDAINTFCDEVSDACKRVEGISGEMDIGLDDYFCIDTQGVFWILGNHGDVIAAHETAISMGIFPLKIFGTSKTLELIEKIGSMEFNKA